MDSSPLSRASSIVDAVEQLKRTTPITQRGSEAVRTSSSAAANQPADVRQPDGTGDALFALERHLPLRILQNPLLLKAEWAWKLLVLQQLAHFPQEVPVEQPMENTNKAMQEEPTQTQATQTQATQTQATQTQATAAAAVSGQPEQNPIIQLAEGAVRELWTLLSSLDAQAADNRRPQVQMEMRVASPLLPFAAMNQDTILLAKQKTDAERLQSWVLRDRLVASVLDNPYERVGGGLFFLPPLNPDDTVRRGIKWEAQRQTRMGATGKLMHRVRIELEVQRQPLTCIITAQRPQLLVHFVSADAHLLRHLEQGAPLLTDPLAACGWDLVQWTTGQADTQGEEGINDSTSSSGAPL
jgi:hypothetical protein